MSERIDVEALMWIARKHAQRVSFAAGFFFSGLTVTVMLAFLPVDVTMLVAAVATYSLAAGAGYGVTYWLQGVAPCKFEATYEDGAEKGEDETLLTKDELAAIASVDWDGIAATVAAGNLQLSRRTLNGYVPESIYSPRDGSLPFPQVMEKHGLAVKELGWRWSDYAVRVFAALTPPPQ